MLKEIKKGFTLAEVLIVIGIIGVVAALTLPNLNHATGDKETVTRVKKAFSVINEANDRAVAIYGPVSTWNTESCHSDDDLEYCWMKRIGEFLKISKSCNEYPGTDDNSYHSCDEFWYGAFGSDGIVYQLPDGITLSSWGEASIDCDMVSGDYKDLCLKEIFIDVDGKNKGKNDFGYDIFKFSLSDSLGFVPYKYGDTEEEYISDSFENRESCAYWVLEYGNLDYLKVDSSGKCNDSNIILDGVTNTSCH